MTFLKYIKYILIISILFLSIPVFAADGFIDERYLNARMNTITERLNGMDKAIDLRVRSEVEKERSLYVKYADYDQKIREIERRLESFVSDDDIVLTSKRVNDDILASNRRFDDNIAASSKRLDEYIISNKNSINDNKERIIIIETKSLTIVAVIGFILVTVNIITGIIMVRIKGKQE